MEAVNVLYIWVCLATLSPPITDFGPNSSVLKAAIEKHECVLIEEERPMISSGLVDNPVTTPLSMSRCFGKEGFEAALDFVREVFLPQEPEEKRALWVIKKVGCGDPHQFVPSNLTNLDPRGQPPPPFITDYLHEPISLGTSRFYERSDML